MSGYRADAKKVHVRDGHAKTLGNSLDVTQVSTYLVDISYERHDDRFLVISRSNFDNVHSCSRVILFKTDKRFRVLTSERAIHFIRFYKFKEQLTS